MGKPSHAIGEIPLGVSDPDLDVLPSSLGDLALGRQFFDLNFSNHVGSFT